MNVKRCIIIDDEPHARKLLNQLISQSAHPLEVVGEASNVDSSITLIETRKPDIIFLDVRIQDRLGFEILDHFTNRKFDVIFTTAFDHYAVDAFQYEAIHYLLKPYSLAALDTALERSINGKSSAQNGSDASGIITIPSRSETLRLKASDILYLIGDGAYTEFYLKGGKSVLASKSLGHFEKELNPNQFVRSHKKYIINLNEVSKYDKGSKPTALMSDGRTLEVSRTYKGNVTNRL
ncbi:MAG: response regulator transcription factor [Flavobacteriia bacterium]|nr:response regulator transcription factor [Flavobacteriia bacterium]